MLFLGVEVACCQRGIFLSQRKYALYHLPEIEMVGAKPYDSPMVPRVKLSPDDGDLFDDLEQYRRLAGKLNYLAMTRPDIAFFVSVMSQFMAAPRVPHWDAAMHILCYMQIISYAN